MWLLLRMSRNSSAEMLEGDWQIFPITENVLRRVEAWREEPGHGVALS